MHWAEKLAREIIEKKPDKEEYVCAAGISPSGSVHIGNFRDIATSYYVVRALRKMGKKARLLFSWDEFDRLRKVPSNIAAITEGFDKYLGMPYAEIPDPHDEYSSYAEYNEKEFEKSLEELDIHPDYRYQAKQYTANRYADGIVFALKNRKQIYDILLKYKTQEENDEDREKYAPVNVYCSACHKDMTEVISVSDDGERLTYRCKVCGKEETINVREYGHVKLVWKVDWPMRWGVEGVDFEPGGIDHAAASGSYVVACDVAKNIFGIEPPLFQGYGWLSISGMGDMHSSTGNNITPAEVLKVYEPDMIRWLFAKYAPEAGFAFNFDDTIIRHYSEFDKGLEAYKKGETDEYNTAVYDYCMLSGKESYSKVPFGALASIATIVDFNPQAVAEMMKKIGVDFGKQDEARLLRVKNWITIYQPGKMFRLLDSKNQAYFDSLDDEDKTVIRKLHDYISANDVDEKGVQNYLYEIINDPACTKKENMARQMKAFKALYNVLFGQDNGPRLYLFLSAVDKSKYLPLLAF